MILLENGNRILGETVAAAFKPPVAVENEDGTAGTAQREPIDVRLCDFDDVSYHVTISADDRDTLLVSMSIPCWRDIKDKGASDSLATVFGSAIVSSPEAGYDVTLSYNLNKLASKADELTTLISRVKLTAVGGVFDRYFVALLAGKPLSDNFTFKLRPDTTLFLLPRNDRLTVIFEIDFVDQVDAALAKVFMSEFVDCRKRLGAAPPCTFSVNAPLELKEFGVTEPSRYLGFVAFAIMKGHLDRNLKEKVTQVLQTFRNYVQYHLKCSKAYFHSRMRARAAGLIKVLNRAKQDTDEKKEKKNFQGKTFIRQS